MKSLSLILAFFISSSLFSQDIEALARKNGFKHFRFGTSSSMYKDLEFVEGDGREKMYTYTGNEINQLFGFDVAIIDLLFFDDKLYNILIYYKNLPVNSFSIVKYELEDNYGKPKIGYNANSTDFSHSFEWRSSKIQLELSRYNSGTSYIGITEMNIFDSKFKDKL